MASPLTDTLDAGASAQRHALHATGARVMGLLLLSMGVFVLALSLLDARQWMTTALWLLRMVLGFVLLLGAGLGFALLRSDRPRAANGVMLSTVALGMAGIAGLSGLGVHTISLASIGVLVALAGALSGTTAASLMALFYLVLIAGFTLAEIAGLLPGRSAAALLSLGDRVFGHVLIAVGAWFAALLLHRVVGSALQQALTEGERLRNLVRLANDWHWEADRKLRLTHVSASFEALTGRKPAEYLRLGQPGGPVLIDDEHAEALREDLRARRPFRDRIACVRCEDGSLLWSLMSGEPVLDAAGQYTGWRGVSHNITAQREAQARHQRTADMLDRLIRVSPDAICVTRLVDGRLIFANAGFLQLAGRSEAEVLGKSGLELGLWADEREAHRLRAALRSAPSLQGFRTVLHLPGQRFRDVLLSAANFEWDGEPVAVLTARDITEAERARVEGDAILENASVGIALTRGERFERSNAQWLEIFGGPSLQLADPNAAGLPSAAEIAQAAQAFERDFVRAGGERITVRFNARALPQTQADGFAQEARALAGEPATIWVAEDVSARRRQERELDAAKLAAEAANAAKGAFLATMSHEIRTPVNGVLGLARLLRQARADDPRRAEYLAHLVGAAESLNEIVTNVLDLSKIEAGALSIEATEFDLHELARASFEGCAALGRERGLSMLLELDPGLPRCVIGDSLRLRQILANLLGNALKFTERGGISLTLCPVGSGRVRVVVSDSGCGVPRESQGGLFKPFAQADGSVTRRFGGTGLGLSICRELAERMGGGVGMASDGVNGSTFWAELALPAAQTEAPPPPPRYPLAGLRVLVAEDNPVNRLVICALLQRLGAEVVEAEDGAQAVQIAKAQARRLDAVLMDLHMPLVDGLRATQLLRADPATAGLPIHAFTAAVLDQERQAALDAGMDGFLTKPVAEAELVKLLRG